MDVDVENDENPDVDGEDEEETDEEENGTDDTMDEDGEENGGSRNRKKNDGNSSLTSSHCPTSRMRLQHWKAPRYFTPAFARSIMPRP